MNVVRIVLGAGAHRHAAHQLDRGLGAHASDDSYHALRAHARCRAG
jgi:hypothetical protein